MTETRTRLHRTDASGHRAPVRQDRRARQRRRTVLAGVVLAALVVTAAFVAVPRLRQHGNGAVCGADDLQSVAVAGLAEYANWLRTNHVSGFVGEVGWPSGPDSARWDALADRWYTAADEIGLPVTAWAAARWPHSYPMAVYSATAGSTTLNGAGPQAAVVERHSTRSRYERGVVVAGGSFGHAISDGRFDGKGAGRYGYDYSYENWDSYAYLARRGVRLVRLAVSWERLQPVPGGPLDSVALSRVQRTLEYARQADIRVILDLHNYGEFDTAGPGGTRHLVLGSPALPIARLADFWSRIARVTRDDPSVVGYDLLNEPHRLAARGAAGAQIWERASRQAVLAIRQAGSRVVVAVTAYGETSPGAWGRSVAQAWVRDPLHRTVYEAHAYFDSDSSGHYASNYATELRRAHASSTPRCQRLPWVPDRFSALIAQGG